MYFILSHIIVATLIFGIKCLVLIAADKSLSENDRPIIGILAQEISYSLNETYDGEYDSYIAASYVKFVEGAGARVVPIWLGGTESSYTYLLSRLNGILLPGGAAYFNVSNGYAESAEKIIRIAKQFNSKGDYFPIWAICLGYEALIYTQNNNEDYRVDCSNKNHASPLELATDFHKSRLFENAPRNLVQIMQDVNVTFNYNKHCFTEESIKSTNVTKEYRILSLNRDKDNLKYISIMENIEMPFYGVQFHPEKVMYEWEQEEIPHSSNAVQVSQYFANFFVNEARKNHHNFSDRSEEREFLIYNHPVKFTALQNSKFEECYLFNMRI